jgi:hypothetical protein
MTIQGWHYIKIDLASDPSLWLTEELLELQALLAKWAAFADYVRSRPS